MRISDWSSDVCSSDLPFSNAAKANRSMILRPYERTIFKRSLLPQRGEGFIFVAAAFSFTAVMLGAAALVVVMSVMNGVRSDLLARIVGLNGPDVVQGSGGRTAGWQEVWKTGRA